MSCGFAAFQADGRGAMSPKRFEPESLAHIYFEKYIEKCMHVCTAKLFGEINRLLVILSICYNINRCYMGNKS